MGAILGVILGIGGIGAAAYMFIPQFQKWLNDLFKPKVDENALREKEKEAKELAAKLEKAEREAAELKAKAESSQGDVALKDAELKEARAQVASLTASKQTADEKSQKAERAATAADVRANAAEQKSKVQGAALLAAQGKLSQAEALNNSLGQQLASVQNDNVNLTQQLSTTMMDLAQKQSDLESAQQTNKLIQDQIGQLETKAADAVKENNRLGGELKKADDQKADLARQLAAKEKDRVNAQTAADDAQANVKKTKDALDELTKNNKTDGAALAKASVDLENATKAAKTTGDNLAAANLAVSNLQSAQQQNEAAIASLQLQLASSKEDAVKANKEKDALQQQVDKLKETVDTLTGKVKDAETARDAAIEQAKQQQAAKEKQAGELASNLEAANLEKEALKKALSALTAASELKDAEIKKLAAGLQTAQNNAAEAKEKAETKTKEADQLKSQLGTANDQVTADKAALAAAGGKNEDLEAKLAASVAAAAALKMKMDEAAAEAAAQKKLTETAQAKADGLSGQLDGLKAAKTRDDKLAKEKQDELAGKLAQKEKDAQKLSDQLAALKEQMKNEKEEGNKRESGLRDQLAANSKTIEGLQGQVKQAELDKQAAATALAQAKKEAGDMRQERDTEAAKATDLQKQVEKLQAALKKKTEQDKEKKATIYPVGWGIGGRNYMHIPLGSELGVVPVVMQPPQKIFGGEDGGTKTYENDNRESVVTMVLPKDAKWSDVDVVDTGKRLTIKGWFNTDGSTRDKVVPYYAITVKGKTVAEFPATVTVELSGRAIDMEKPKGDAPKRKPFETKTNMISHYPIRSSKKPDDDTAIDQEYIESEYRVDDSTFNKMKNRSVELPLAVFKNKINVMKKLEEQYETIDVGETGFTPTPDAPSPKLSPEEMQKLLEKAGKEFLKSISSPFTSIANSFLPQPKKKSEPGQTNP